MDVTSARGKDNVLRRSGGHAGRRSWRTPPDTRRPLGAAAPLPGFGPSSALQRRDADPVVDLSPPRSFYTVVVKPALDWTITLLLTIVLLSVMIPVAAALWVSIGSPVLFRQERIGKDGRRFTMYKFRTMAPDRRRQDLPFDGVDRRQCHKVANDPRITPIGRFLRKWSLDELPQLFNVLAGHMSLVGPRPELPLIVDRYEPWQHERHAVKPGLTGSWQISERGDKLLHECTTIDLDYVRNLSFWSDLRILVGTPKAVLTRRGF